MDNILISYLMVFKGKKGVSTCFPGGLVSFSGLENIK